MVNEEEAGWLAGHLRCLPGADGLHAALGIDVVVTLGEAGLELAGPDGRVRLPAHSVIAIDTTGAGDCFTGVLAAGLDRGLTLEAAARRANVAAGLCCARAGTQGSMPDAAETEAEAEAA